MVRLVHYMSEGKARYCGESEYLALLSESEDVNKYLEEGFSVHGTFLVEGSTWDDNEQSLPLDRAFVEG